MHYVYDKNTGILRSIDGKVVVYTPSPHMGGTLVAPSIAVTHYTGSGGADNKGDVGWFQNPQSKVSAHFVIGRDGGITQCVPLTREAWHAGTSIWRGRANCNNFSVGIEFDNWGLLLAHADGKFRSSTGKEVPAESVVMLPFKVGGTVTPWEVYTPAQIEAGINLLNALVEILPIKEVVGHQDIAPGRKVDPGPAFDMLRMRLALEGRNDSRPSRQAAVQAYSLNLRSGASTKASLLGSLKLRDFVDVQYESNGWAYVTAHIGTDTKNGWVSSQYINYV